MPAGHSANLCQERTLEEQAENKDTYSRTCVLSFLLALVVLFSCLEHLVALTPESFSGIPRPLKFPDNVCGNLAGFAVCSQRSAGVRWVAWQTGWLKPQKLVSHSSGGWKCKIKVCTNSVSGGSGLLGFLQCPHNVERESKLPV